MRFACNGRGRSVFEFSPPILLDQSQTCDVTILAAGLGLISADRATTTFAHPRAAVSPDDVTGCYEWSGHLIDWYHGQGMEDQPGGGTVEFSVRAQGMTSVVTATASPAMSPLYLRVGAMQNQTFLAFSDRGGSG